MKWQRVLDFDSFYCGVCHSYIYDENKGDPDFGIKPNTQVDFLPDSWRCPLCGATKENLRATTLIDDFVPEKSFTEVQKNEIC